MKCFISFIQGYVDIVRLLLKHGAKVEETNENGHTPLVNFSTKKIDLLYLRFVFRWKQQVEDMLK